MAEFILQRWIYQFGCQLVLPVLDFFYSCRAPMPMTDARSYYYPQVTLTSPRWKAKRRKVIQDVSPAFASCGHFSSRDKLGQSFNLSFMIEITDGSYLRLSCEVYSLCPPLNAAVSDIYHAHQRCLTMVNQFPGLICLLKPAVQRLCSDLCTPSINLLFSHTKYSILLQDQ